MKNIFKVLGIITLVTVIGFSMTACDNGGGGGGGLPAPTGLTATATSSSVITLNWNAVPGAAGYNIYQSQSSSSGFQLLGTSQTNSTTNSSLPPNTTVYYKVAAYSADGTEGAMSNVASATTLSGSSGGSLPAPTGLTATLSSTTLMIFWNAVTGAAGYNLYISADNSTFEAVDAYTNTTIPMPLSELPSGTYTLYFKVAAYSSNRTEGAMSNVISKTITNGSTPSYSLDGVWKTEGGVTITISGSTGILSAYTGTNPRFQSAIDKGYYIVGTSQYCRNITSTGNLTWSGQVSMIQAYSSNPNVAVGTSWGNVTITMSADGQTLTITGTDAGGSFTDTWTRN